MSTWHGAEGALGVHGGLDGDDALSLWTPALLTLSLHLKQVGVIWQQVLDDHGVLSWVCHIDALHLTCRKHRIDMNGLHEQELELFYINVPHLCQNGSLCLPPLSSW